MSAETPGGRFAALFEPLRIGPVTAPNRFYQVPHCSGMGYQRPGMMATMRGIKAEGGWGVVCTEYCSIDAGADETPYPSASLRDDDVRNLRAMTEAVHDGHRVARELGGPAVAARRERVVL